jgi:hypothetical protein
VTLCSITLEWLTVIELIVAYKAGSREVNAAKTLVAPKRLPPYASASVQPQAAVKSGFVVGIPAFLGIPAASRRL